MALQQFLVITLYFLINTAFVFLRASLLVQNKNITILIKREQHSDIKNTLESQFYGCVCCCLLSCADVQVKSRTHWKIDFGCGSRCNKLTLNFTCLIKLAKNRQSKERSKKTDFQNSIKFL